MKNIIFLFLFGFSFQLNAQDNLEKPIDSLQKRVFEVIDKVKLNHLFVDVIDENALTSLPIGLIKEIGNTRYIIAIDSAFFKPNGAYFNAYMAIEVPNTTKRIAFAAKNIKFNPKGVVGGEQSKLVLVSEHLFKISPKVALHLIPNGQNYIEWNCEGFQSVNLQGNFEFSNDWLLPAPSQNQSEPVSAIFNIHTNDIHNFVTSVSFTPFTLKGLNGWEFSVNNAVVDLSELANHPATQFPSNYQLPFVNSPEFWTGFFLQNLTIKLPPELSKHNQPTTITANNLLIDNTGFTGEINVLNVLAVNDGSASGWGFSIDEFGVKFISNQLIGGNMKGLIKIPAMENNGLIYSAILNYNPNQQLTNYLFTLSAQENISLNAFTANVDIFSTSQIQMQLLNGKFIPKAILNGRISFNHENASTPKLNFQSLTFETIAPYLTNGVLSYTSAADSTQSKVAKYNVSINNLRIVLNNSKPKFGMDVHLNFMQGGTNNFSATTGVEFIANTGNNPNASWSFDKVRIDRINLETNTTAFYFNGYLDFNDNDPIFGDGFAGGLAFKLNNVMTEEFQIDGQFGCTTFKYFYVDIYFPTKITLGNTEITKLMGGLFYHMRPVANSPAQFYSNIENVPHPNAHREKYIPDQTIGVGFKAGVNFQSKAGEKAMNGDALLTVAFQSSGGLDFINFQGAVYMMATVQERKTKPAPVSGSALIIFDNVNKIFDATLNANVNTNGIVGNAIAKIHIEPNIWFVCVGRPSQPATVTIFNLATVSAYVLVGNQLEPMQPPPAIVASLVSLNGLDNLRNNEALSNASGFALGIRFGISHSTYREDAKFQIYASFAFGIGFDMMLTNYGQTAHCQNEAPTVGLNGWVAQGQLYAYLQGVVGVKGRILKKDFDIKIIDGTVAALLAGKIPKPSYVYGALAVQYSILGLLNGSFNLDFEFGNNCTIQS